MPPHNRRRSNDDDGLEQLARSTREGRDDPPVESAQPRTGNRPSEHEKLLTEQQVFGGDGGTAVKEADEHGEYAANDVDHAPILSNVASHVQRPCASSFCGAHLLDGI
jgi:hypothetical protein